MPFMPPSSPYMKKKKLPPPTVTNPYAMQSEAAGMAADALGATPPSSTHPTQVTTTVMPQAPIVPTTNINVRKPTPAPLLDTDEDATPMAPGTEIPFRGAPVKGGAGGGYIKPVTPPREGLGATGTPVGESSVGDYPLRGAPVKGDGRDPRVPTGQPPNQNELYERAIATLLGSGPRDTAEDERLIREQMLNDVGAGQANLNARMAASGFGTSGALGALSGDMRSRASLDAAKAISSVKQSARDEYLDKLGLGLKASNEAGSLELRQKAYDAMIQAIKDLQGDGEGGGGGDVENPLDDFNETFPGGPTEGWGDSPEPVATVETLRKGSDPPRGEGWKKTGTDKDGNTLWYNSDKSQRYTQVSG
jgi:hypothetical protein